MGEATNLRWWVYRISETQSLMLETALERFSWSF